MAVYMFDIDGTIDANPHHFCRIMCALKAQGDHVSVVSGSGNNPPSGNTFQDKCNYLCSLGVTECWDDLTVISGDIPAGKAKWAQENGCSVAFDNSKANAKALLAAGVPLVLVPWATRVDGE